MAGYNNSYTPQYPGTTTPLNYNYNYQVPQYQAQMQPQMQVPAQSQMQPQQVQPQPQSQQQQEEEGGINWVQGEAGARSAFVKPGRSKLLMDSEQPVFYIKSVDVSGMPLPLRIYDFNERVSKPQNSNSSKQNKKEVEYVKKDELESLVSEIMKKKSRGNKNE